VVLFFTFSPPKLEIHHMKKIALAVFVAAQALALSAFAQDAKPEVKPRADVKAEATTANKAGTIPHGEQDVKMPAAASTTKRADVKADAAAANKAGTIEKGTASDMHPKKTAKMSKEEKAAARAKRKAETAAAAKAGEIPKGEAAPK
jgi:hypothetical protein